ncbi:MAG TPA: hypothetical protein DCP40_03695, partial [Stenotrophomonas sp.]|nr:hypothetical protein [Stenotrophomonas sp.]
VKRVVNGQTVQYIEQLAPTRYDDPLDWKYADSLLTFDGRNKAGTTVALSTAGGWTENDTITATASEPIFAGEGDVGDILLITAGSDRVRVRIAALPSSTVATVESIGEVPASLRGVPLQGWTFQRSTIS